MITTYSDTVRMLHAIRDGRVPAQSVSPGSVAARLSVTRQRVHQLVEEGRLDCWKVRDGSMVLISLDSVQRLIDARRGEHRKTETA